MIRRLSPLCRRLTNWRTLRWVVAVPAIPFALWACTSHPLEAPQPAPEQQSDLFYEVNPVRDLDILVMVDNSPSMAEEQGNLGRNFPALMKVLEEIPGGLPNVHIGVVSSDMGAGPSTLNNGQCRPDGDRGIFQNGAGKNCNLDANSRFIISSGTVKNFQGSLGDVFKCIATVGVNGCGFEHQLQATRVALTEQFAPENKGFLRPNAFLAIILLTDEDDCSAAQNSNLFTDPAYMGTSSSFRCAHQGHTCAGKQPPIDAFTSPLGECKAAENTRLFPVQEIVKSIRALKQRPDQQILVSGIFGWNTPNTPYRYTKSSSGEVDYGKICESPGNGAAVAGLRMKEFVDSFAGNGLFFSICQDDFTPAMKTIGDKLKAVLGNPCIGSPLVDTKKTEAGLQAECAVVDKYPVMGGFRDEPLPQCGTPGATGPCWKLVEDMSCAVSRRKVEVDRKGMMAPQGTQQSIKCATCPVGAEDCGKY